MRSKHLFLVFRLLMVAVLALSASAPPATSPAPAATTRPGQQPTEAAAAPPSRHGDLGFLGQPEEAASHKIVADAFMVEHPEITIDL